MALNLLCDQSTCQGYDQVLQRAYSVWYSISNESIQSIILSIPCFDFTRCICIPFRSGIKKVIQLLLQLRSVDKARLIAVEHNVSVKSKLQHAPPRATPRAFDFFENYCSNSPLPGPKCRSNAPH